MELHIFDAAAVTAMTGLDIAVARRAMALSESYPLERIQNDLARGIRDQCDWVAYGDENRPGVGVGDAAIYFVAELFAVFGRDKELYDRATAILRAWFASRMRSRQECDA